MDKLLATEKNSSETNGLQKLFFQEKLSWRIVLSTVPSSANAIFTIEVCK